MNNILLIITPYDIIGMISLYLILLISAFYLIGKYEKGWIYFAWLITIVMLPVLGPLAYFLKYLANKPKMTPAN